MSSDSPPLWTGEPFGSRTRRRARLPSVRSIVILLVVGLGLLVAFVVVVNAVGSRSDRLRAHGIRESGTISQLSADSGLRSGRGWVSYRVGSQTLVGSVDLGSDVANYQVGQTVRVFYDRRHPATMTIDQEDNQFSFSVELTVVALVLGVGCTGVAVSAAGLRLVRRWRPNGRAATRRPPRLLLGRHVRIANNASTVLGWGSWPLLLIGAAGVVISAVFMVQGAHSHVLSTAGAIGNAGGFGAFAALMFVLATCRVSGRTDGTLHLINAMFEIRIPVSDIGQSRAEGGLQIVILDGRRFGSSAFSASVLGNFLGYQRANRVLERLNDWRSAPHPTTEQPTVTTASRRLRPAVWIAPAWILGYMLTAAIITTTR
jgi:hypothetical protein